MTRAEPKKASDSYASLGGQPLISIGSALSAFAENGWDYSKFAGQANGFSTSIGEEPGRGRVLMGRSALNNLLTYVPLELEFGQGDSDESIQLQGIYIRAATRVSPGESQHKDAIYLVDLVDTRYYLRRKTVNKRYNCRALRSVSDSFVEATTNSGTPWTWPEVITDLWEANIQSLIGGIGDLPDLSDLESVPENLRYEGISAWAALNDACSRCGCAVVYDNAFASNFYVVRLGVISGDEDPPFFGEGGTDVTTEGQEANLSSDPLVRPAQGGDGLFLDEEVLQGNSIAPKIVTVMFPTEFGASQLADELTSDYGKWYAVKIDGSDPDVLPSHIACEFHDEDGDAKRIPRPDWNGSEDGADDSEAVRYELMTARFESSSDAEPTNQADLEVRAKEIARDIYRTLHDCSYAHMAFMGISFRSDEGTNVTVPGKCLTSVTWGDFGSGFTTHFRRSIPILLPTEPFLIPQPGGGSGGGGASQIQFAITDVVCSGTTVESITGTVADVICGATDPIVGEEIDLIDPQSLLVGYPAAIIGRSGFAVRMEQDDSGPYPTGCSWKIVNVEAGYVECSG